LPPPPIVAAAATREDEDVAALSGDDADAPGAKGVKLKLGRRSLVVIMATTDGLMRLAPDPTDE